MSNTELPGREPSTETAAQKADTAMPAQARSSNKSPGVWSWVSGVAALFSGVSGTLLLLGYGAAMAVESRLGIVRSSLFDSAIDLLELSSIPALMILEAFGRSLGDLWWQIYRQSWLLVVALLLIWGAMVPHVWRRHRSGAPDPGRAESVLSRGPQWLERHALAVKLTLFTGFIAASPLVVVALTLLALMVLFVPAIMIAMGMNATDRYLQQYVLEPVECTPVVKYVWQAGLVHASKSVSEQPTQAHQATCVVLENTDGQEVARGRLAVSSTKAMVLVLKDGLTKRFDASALTQYAVSEL